MKLNSFDVLCGITVLIWALFLLIILLPLNLFALSPQQLKEIPVGTCVKLDSVTVLIHETGFIPVDGNDYYRVMLKVKDAETYSVVECKR
jgi:hypothetical protein